MGQHQQALAVENDGHFEGRRWTLPYEPILGDFVEIVREGRRARKERGVSVSGSGMRKERQAGRRTQNPCWAHLCYYTDAPHNGCSFGLSPAHSTQSRCDKDLPSQVLNAQVSTPSIQHGELQGKESGIHCPCPAHQLSVPQGQAWSPFSHHCAMDDSLGTNVAITACCHLAVPDRREGKQRGEPSARHSFSQPLTLDDLKWFFNYSKMYHYILLKK